MISLWVYVGCGTRSFFREWQRSENQTYSHTRGNVSHKVRRQSRSQERGTRLSSFVLKRMFTKGDQACLTPWPQSLGAACCSAWRGTEGSPETARRNPPVRHSLTAERSAAPSPTPPPFPGREVHHRYTTQILSPSVLHLSSFTGYVSPRREKPRRSEATVSTWWNSGVPHFSPALIPFSSFFSLCVPQIVSSVSIYL